MQFERDTVEWIADAATIISGFLGLVAIYLSVRAVRDSKETAQLLLDTHSLARQEHHGQVRARAALVFSAADQLRLRIKSFWQTGIQAEPPRQAQIRMLRDEFDRDLQLAKLLEERASRVDPAAVQLAFLIRWRFEALGALVERVGRIETASRAPGQSSPLLDYRNEWEPLFKEMLGVTVELIQLLDRIDRHFPPEFRTIEGQDRIAFAEQVIKEVKGGREDEVARLIANPPGY